jgi:thioesterase domain-containing protein
MARLFATGAHTVALQLLRDYLYLVDESRAATPRRFASLPAIQEWMRAVQRLPRGSELLRTFVARSTIAHLVPPESRLLALRQPAIMPLFELYVLHCRLTLEYEPRAYPYKINLFKATDLRGARARDATQGWRMLAAGGVDVHRVPGDHMSLLRQPHVQVLAAKLAACLEEAQRELDGEDGGTDIL